MSATRWGAEPGVMLTEAERAVEAWLDDDEELRIPDTAWGGVIYDGIRSLLAARRDPTVPRRTEAEVKAEALAPFVEGARGHDREGLCVCPLCQMVKAAGFSTDPRVETGVIA